MAGNTGTPEYMPAWLATGQLEGHIGMLQDPALAWQLSWAFNNAPGAVPVHVDSVTGARLTSQSQSTIHISGNAPVNGDMPANVNVYGHFDTTLPGASTAESTGAQSDLQLQFVALNGQMCSLTGTVPSGAPSPSPAQVETPTLTCHENTSLI